MKLTKKEENEPVFITLGRLKQAIRQSAPIERQLILFEKVSKDVSELDIQVMQLEREKTIASIK